MRKRFSSYLAVAALAAATSVALAGCGGSGAATVKVGPTPTRDPNATFGTPVPTRAPAAIKIGAAPSPASVDVTQLTMIPEWSDYKIPQYPGSEKLAFEALSSADVKNAGIMRFKAGGTPEQALAFYRGALVKLGWKEIAATGVELGDRRDNAGLMVLVGSQQGTTIITLTLSD